METNINPEIPEIPWTEKYRPRRLGEVVGQFRAKKEILDFIKNFSKQRKKAALIYGPAGSGKTSIIYALAHEFNYEIIELNASDFRNKYQIQEIIGKAIRQQSLFSRNKKNKIMLIDEVDGITGTRDRGGLRELLRLITETTYPMILVANDVWKSKLRPLRSKTKLIELKPIKKEDIISLLYNITKKEKLRISMEALGALSIASKGDARAAITDLQVLSSTYKKDKEITKKSVMELYDREKDENIFNAIRQVFKLKEGTLNIFNNVQNINTDDIFLWIDENLPLEYNGPDLVRAYAILSKADIFRGRIRRWQHWHFLVYIMALLTEGISSSKKKERQDFTSYKPPTRILKIWLAKQKQKERKEQAQKLAKIMHISKKRAYKELPFLEIAFKGSIPIEITNL